MPDDEAGMTEEIRSQNGRVSPVGLARPAKYDLEERTARFGEAIIAPAKKIPLTPVTEPIVRQFVDSGTSVGSNYCEADDAGSKKEFRYRISLCKRESRETKFWLRMIATAVPD